MKRILHLLPTLCVLQICLYGADAAAQECPGRANLREIAVCLGRDRCDREIAIDDLDSGDCERSIAVWWRDPLGQSAVIRDGKMCQSQRRHRDPNFVHGLLLPIQHISTERICGVEDEKLYADSSPYRAIWQSAWDAALLKLGEEEIALVINPSTIRGEGHLHIHIVRWNGVALPMSSTTSLANLDNVWREAEAFALSKGIAEKNYGILVLKSGGAFQMLVEPGRPINAQNPEKKYTRYED